jgi:hypothetical protein
MVLFYCYTEAFQNTRGAQLKATVDWLLSGHLTDMVSFFEELDYQPSQ